VAGSGIAFGRSAIGAACVRTCGNHFIPYDTRSPRILDGFIFTCNLGTVGSGSTATIDIVVKPTVSGPITNTASASTSTADPNGDNNADSENTSVLPHHLAKVIDSLPVATSCSHGDLLQVGSRAG